MSRRVVLPAVALLAVVRPLPAWSQAVCSAPHSSPVLAGGGSLGTLPPGSGWVQVSAFRQRSTEFFGTGGGRQPFLADGRVTTSSLYLTGGIGVLRGLDLWAQLPTHAVSYVDEGGTRTRTGIGDPRIAVRIGPELAGLPPIPLALRAGLKLSGSRFPVDATIIPLGEGQTDWEVSVESGHALGRLPLYLMGWVGYRWRSLNREADRKPGDEWFGHLAAGGTAFSLRWELAVEQLLGTPPRHLGFEVPTSKRRLTQLQPTLARPIGPGELELTGLVPLAGRNLPSGPGFSLGYRVSLVWDGGPRVLQAAGPPDPR